MPGIVNLIRLWSLDVTRGLVAQGLGLGYDADAAASASSGTGRFTATPNPATGLPYAPLAITGATATTPIVVTTQYPHGITTRGIGGMSCIIRGVQGMPAANNIDRDTRSVTIGTPAGIHAVPTGSTTLALYGQDPTTGALVPLSSSGGTYTGGGTITPAFTDGSILIGRESVRENSAPPRIVMIPRGVSEWSAKSVGIPNGDRTADRRAMSSQRTLRSELDTFEIHCWGASTPPDPAADFDITQALYQQVITSAHLLFGTPEDRFGGGSWDDERERATQHVKTGHLFIFTASIQTPVLDGPLGFVPASAYFDVEKFSAATGEAYN